MSGLRTTLWKPVSHKSLRVLGWTGLTGKKDTMGSSCKCVSRQCAAKRLKALTHWPTANTSLGQIGCQIS